MLPIGKGKRGKLNDLKCVYLWLNVPTCTGGGIYNVSDERDWCAVLFCQALGTSTGRIKAKQRRPQTARWAETQAQRRGCGVGLTLALCTDTKSGGFTSRGQTSEVFKRLWKAF